MPLDQPIPTDRVESPKETNNSPLVSDLLINKQSETKEVRQNTLIRSNEELMKQNYLPKVAMDNPDKRSDLLTNNLSDKKDNPIRDYVNNTGLDTKTPARVDKNEKGEIVKIEPGQNYPSDGTSFEKRGDKWVELNLRFFSGREVNDVSMKANGDIVVTNHDESY
ncbi:MAG: hypothetical protein K8F91_04440, partial [Candidatus Obscuribacterales bacterium]|nr:hypothetical protein [Candidatus Obscuribacterales bacterium]